MRQKADKLEKGKWYADLEYGPNTCFLRYSHSDDDTDYSDMCKGFNGYGAAGGLIPFTKGIHESFIPTPEDIEKYNLKEQE